MRRTILAAALLAAIGGGAAQAHHQQLTLALGGPLQARFAGYFVADYQGFYDEGEVAVRIEPGGGAQALADGRADIVVATLPEALAARAGYRPGQYRADLRALGRRPDLPQGRRHHEPARSRRQDGGPPAGRRPLSSACLAEATRPRDRRLGPGSRPARPGPGRGPAAAAAGGLHLDRDFEQQLELEDAGLQAADLTVFSYEEEGVATLADGLYVLAGELEDPDRVQSLGAFLHHSMRGWLWARRNPVEAARIVLEHDSGHRLSERRQVRVMAAVNRLTAGGTGALSRAAFARTVGVMEAAGATGLAAAAEGGWSDEVVAAAGLGTLAPSPAP